MRSMTFKTMGMYLMVLFYVCAGIRHFTVPDFYMKIMPPFVPDPLFVVYLSGVLEIALGVGLLWEKHRRWVAWGIIALLVAVFPANVYMWTAHIEPTGKPIPEWLYMVRLPLQGVLIYWAYIYTKK